MSQKFSQTLGQDHGNTRPKTVFTPQPPTFVRDKIDYSKSYHMIKGEGSNINGTSEKKLDLSEHISKRLIKTAMSERRPGNVGTVTGVSPVIMLLQLHCQ